MKSFYSLFLTGTCLMVLSACSEQESPMFEQDGKVRLNVQVENHKITRLGDSWNGDERIGVFMVEPDTFAVVENVANKEYRVSAGSGNELVAAGEEDVYPDDGRNVRFVAYYPFNGSLVNAIYKINLGNKSAIDHDLLYTRTEYVYNREEVNPVPLRFSHQLSKMIIYVHGEKDGIEEDISGWSAQIYRSTTADFDLKKGVLSSKSGFARLEMSVVEGRGEALVLPGKEGKVVIAYDGSYYEWDTDQVDLKAGVQYTFALGLELTNEPESEPVKAKLISSVEGWDEVTGEAVLKEKDPDNGDGVLSRLDSNIDLSAVQEKTSAYPSTIRIGGSEYPGLKLGSSTALGKCRTLPLGAGKTRLALYAMAWNEKTANLKITLSGGGLINGATSVVIPVKSNPGIAGGGDIYTINVSDQEYFEYDLSGITDASTFIIETLTTGADKRAVILGVQVD